MALFKTAGLQSICNSFVLFYLGLLESMNRCSQITQMLDAARFIDGDEQRFLIASKLEI